VGTLKRIGRLDLLMKILVTIGQISTERSPESNNPL
jgi:hypothetical protein